MHFFAGFCIFATAFVLGQCDQPFNRKHYDYNVPTKIDCRAVRKTVIETMTNSTCKPHSKLVPLKPMPMHEFHPSVVSINRCDGNCPGHTCLPIKTRMIKVPVKLMSYNRNDSSKMACALVEVEEHLQCRCKCQDNASHCNAKQHHNKDRCACECTDRELQKSKCEAKIGMVWDDEDCSCNCTEHILECRSGQEWNRDKCECV